MPNTIKAGVLLGLALYAVHSILVYSGLWGAGLRHDFPIAICVTQLTYIIPAGLMRKGSVAAGLLIVMGLTFLIGFAICGAMVLKH